MTVSVGSWVKNEPGQKWHIVESLVAGDAVTRCGRRLADPFAETADVEPLTTDQFQLCRRCKP